MRRRALVLLTLGTLTLAGCGGHAHRSATSSRSAAGAANLPGAGRPLVVVGDKNITEQFVLGELYAQALRGQGYTVQLNPDIGPTSVSFQALLSGRLSVYPEYLRTWDATVVGDPRAPSSLQAALRVGRRFARAHGLRLLAPTPFSDTEAIAVTRSYAAANGLRALGDLRRVAAGMTVGGPPQVAQEPGGLPEAEQVYGFTPAAYVSEAIGDQYGALDSGQVQAGIVDTTDGQLTTGRYRTLSDPHHAFGWGEVVPVVPARVLAAEGADFARTLARVDRLLTVGAIRRLNAAVDEQGEDPAVVAQRFLQAHGLLGGGSPPPSSS